MEFKLNASVVGRYRMVIKKANGEIREDTGWFENLITNLGLNKIADGPFPNVCSRCCVGSGAATPLPTDVKLQSHVATKLGQLSLTHGNVITEPIYGWSRSVFQFAEGAAAGTLAEVGVGWGGNTTGIDLFSRARIKNSLGEEILLTVLSDEILEVTYELRLYPPTDDVVSTMDLNGTTHTITARPSNTNTINWQPARLLGTGHPQYTVAVYSGVIGTRTQAPSGTGSVNTAHSFAPYVQDSFKLKASPVWGLNNGNFAEFVKSLSYTTYSIGSFQFGFEPPLPKNADRILTITVEMSWNRHDPGVI